MNQTKKNGNWKRKMEPYAFLVPLVLILFLFLVIPLVKAAIMSFQYYYVTKPSPNGHYFVGLENYGKVLQDEYFFNSVKVTLIYIVVTVAGRYIIGFITALLLNTKFLGRGLARALIIIPWAVPEVVACLVWILMYDKDYGIINFLLNNAGILSHNIAYLQDVSVALPAAMVVNIWKGFPYVAIMLLAGMQSVSTDLYEAADIDGATTFQKIRYITIPAIRSVSTTVFLLLIIWTIKDYAIAYVLTKGGPSRATELLTIYIQQTGFKYFDFGKDMKKRTGRKVITVILVVIVCMFALFPFVWMISTSFKTAGEVYSKTPSFIPKAATMQGYKEMLTTDSTTFNFMQWLGNSVIVSLLTTAFSMIIATLGGYGISRFRFRGRGFLSYFILTTQVLPGSLLIIPLYVIMGNLQLLDTKIGLVAAYCTFSIPFCTWMMKGFFDTIPISLEEAARVDGAGRFRIFATVILPLTVPGLVATGIFSFINGWNEYLFASTFMKSYENWTLPIGIASFSGQYATNWGTLMAGAVLITLPVVIMFLLLQKHLVSGMTAGAVKQ